MENNLKVFVKNYIEFHSVVNHFNSLIGKDNVKEILYGGPTNLFIGSGKIKYKRNDLKEINFLSFEESGIQKCLSKEMVVSYFNYNHLEALEFVLSLEDKSFIDKFALAKVLNKHNLLSENFEKLEIPKIICLEFSLDHGWKYIYSKSNELIIFNKKIFHDTMASYSLGKENIVAAGFVVNLDDKLTFYGESGTLGIRTPDDTSKLEELLLSSNFKLVFKNGGLL